MLDRKNKISLPVEFNFKNGKIFRLLIQNYEFPQATANDFIYDRNWLTVQVEVESESIFLKKQAPALLTWELKSLLNEFKRASEKNLEHEKEILFLEPNLSFKIIPLKNSHIIRLYLDAEFKPEKLKDRGEFYLEGKFSFKDLSIIVNQLHEQMEMFPER